MGSIPDNRSMMEVLDLQDILTPYLVFDKYYNKDEDPLIAIIGKIGNDELVANWQANSIRCFEILASTSRWDEMKITMSESDRFAHMMHWVSGRTLPNSRYMQSTELLNAEEYYLRTEKPPSVRSCLSRPKVVSTSFYLMTSFNSSSVEDNQVVKLLNLDPLRGIRGPLPALLPLLEGISTPIFYVGLAGSSTGCHVEECLLSSVNLLMCGKSTWIFIDPEDNQKLEDLIRENEKSLRASPYKIACRFPLAHKQRYIPLWQLRHHNIRYSVVNQQAGEVIFVAANVYHQVFNSTDCIKVAYASTSLQWYDLFSNPKEYHSKLRMCTCIGTYNFRTRDIIRIKFLMQMTNHSLESIRHRMEDHLHWAKKNASEQYLEEQKHLLALIQKGRKTSKSDDNQCPNSTIDDKSSGDEDNEKLLVPFGVVPGKCRKKKKLLSQQETYDDVESKKCKSTIGKDTQAMMVGGSSVGMTLNHIVYPKKGPSKNALVLLNQSVLNPYKSNFKTCKYCDRRFPRQYIKIHYDKEHSHECDICYVVFKKWDLLKRHKKNSHSQKEFQCDNCDMLFTTKRARYKHVQTTHPQNSQSTILCSISVDGSYE